jgi:3-oxoacyl-[acyl-carrier-protein] synthase II
MSQARGIALFAGAPVLPPAQEIFSRRVPRYGRFDAYTKLGCACIALALQDAGLADVEADRPVGIVSSSRFECFEADAAYYQTAIEEGGALASPNLFSYTVPGVMAGECAVHFHLTGPTFCVGEQGGRGMAALRCAMNMLENGMAEAMVAGWLDAPLAETAQDRAKGKIEDICGAAFVVLERKTMGTGRSEGAEEMVKAMEAKIITFEKQNTITCMGKTIDSLMELFGGA